MSLLDAPIPMHTVAMATIPVFRDLPLLRKTARSMFNVTSKYGVGLGDSFTKYRFTNFDTGQTDDSADFTEPSILAPFLEYSTKSMERGKLLSKTITESSETDKSVSVEFKRPFNYLTNSNSVYKSDTFAIGDSILVVYDTTNPRNNHTWRCWEDTKFWYKYIFPPLIALISLYYWWKWRRKKKQKAKS
jgi:hypothetical protein